MFGLASRAALPEVPGSSQRGRDSQLRTFRATLNRVVRKLKLSQQKLGKELHVSDRQMRNYLDDEAWLRGDGFDQLLQVLRKLAHREFSEELESQLRSAHCEAFPAVPPAVDPGTRLSTLPAPDEPLHAVQRQHLTDLLDRSVQTVAEFFARRYALLRLGRIGSDVDDLHANFVKLTLQPTGNSTEDAQPRRFDSLATLLTAPEAVESAATCAWQLRGEPGAGKSTLLLDLELRSAYQACQAWAADHHARPQVCVRISLANMPAPVDSQALDDWVQARWEDSLRTLQQSGHQVPALPLLHRQARVRFLLDGVNEMRVAGGQRRAAVNTLCKWASEQIAAQRPGPVFTVRRLNYLPFPQGPEFALTRVADVEPWNEAAIKSYCDRRFPPMELPQGEELGTARASFSPAEATAPSGPLWRAIDSHPRRHELLQLFGNPFNLSLQGALYRQQGAKGSVAANRAALMGRIALVRLAAALQRQDPALAAPGLVDGADGTGDEERIAEALSSRASAALHDVVLRGRLVPLLQQVAFAQHGLQRGGWARWGEQDTIDGMIAADWEPALKAAAALQMASLSVLNRDDGDSRGAEWCFSHQLWQEYLAASALAGRGAAWTGIQLEAPAPACADPSAWELAQPEPVFWDQAVQLAVQMAPRAAANLLLEDLMVANLALAARAAAGRHADVRADLLASIKSGLLVRCRSAQALAAVRIEAGLLLGKLGDDQRFERHGGLEGACHVLPAPAFWIGAAWPASAAIGSKAGEFEIAFAPVTNAEFACFVEAGGYGRLDDPSPPPWWSDVAAGQWWHGRVTNEGRRRWWNELRREWRQPGWEAVRRSTLSNWRDEDIARVIEPVLNASARDFDAAVARASAGRPYREPDGWHINRLRNPLQPVVGVCLWEALAYCRWLSASALGSGWQYELPSEAEWKAAAALIDKGRGRPAPGAVAAEPDCNCFELRARRTTPIGVFPASTSAAGLVDLAGQVWEWTTSAATKRRVGTRTATSVSEASTAGMHLACGGSWDCPAANCGSAARKRFDAGNRDDDLGFRLVRRRAGQRSA